MNDKDQTVKEIGRAVYDRRIAMNEAIAFRSQLDEIRQLPTRSKGLRQPRAFFNREASR